jgi:hypothetical protein
VVDTVPNNLAGHFRLSATGVIEFASGYDDATLPRSVVAASVAETPSRGWLHASAAATVTGERILEIGPCDCGASRPVSGLGHARSAAPNHRRDPFKAATKTPD